LILEFFDPRIFEDLEPMFLWSGIFEELEPTDSFKKFKKNHPTLIST
jgi:hypothetical protein